jgi:hypothetical protein
MTPTQRLARIHSLRRKIAEQQRRHGRRAHTQQELERLVAQQVKAECSFFGRLAILIFGGRRCA